MNSLGAISIRYSLLLKFFLGFFFALALPPVSQVWSAAVSLSGVVLLDAIQPPKSRFQSFGGGFFFGLGYFSFALHWIGFAFLVDAKADLWMMPFAVGGLAAFFALYWGVAFLAVERLVARGFERWLVLPLMLGLVEGLRGYLFTGFPWAVPGLMADGMGGVLQFASVVGMPGLTLFIVLWAVLPAAIILHRHSRTALIPPVLLLLTLPAIWWWGDARLANHPFDANSGPLIRLVQPNIAQSDKWRSENSIKVFNDLMALTTAAGKTPELPKVVIWPESAVSFLLDESTPALERIASGLGEGQTLLTGAIRRQTGPRGDDYFTSILGIDSQGLVQSRYDKWRLVPGGEYLPLAWLLEPLGFRKVVNLPEAFSPGSGPGVSDVIGIGPAAMLICYEVIFPHRLLPDGIRPRWIVNVTNDGWFGRSVGPWQHLAQVRMRAIEQGLPIARSANTGISTVYDAFGRSLIQSKLEAREFIDTRLPESITPTVFARAGVVPACILWLFLLLCTYLHSMIVFRRDDDF
jgi:apolipoprotein N-acyltransferase